MLIITGAAGFIGSYLAQFLNQQGRTDLVLVDDFSRKDKERNLKVLQYEQRLHRDTFLEWFAQNHTSVEAVFHLGARTDTSEKDTLIFDRLNLNYSKQMWKICSLHKIPLIYASSAATYGLGEYGYDDRHDIVNDLQPLNPYGVSKNDFDKWALQQTQAPPFWAGLKFFNVYGPNEYHKGRMASVVFHAFHQIQQTGGMRLFRSHRADIANGYQSRDFIYVKDVVNVCYFLYQNQSATKVENGLYNLGTGQARTFLDLVSATFEALNLPPNISFIDTPLDIRATYQYFTEANMSKLQSVGYTLPFWNLEDGVRDYVQGYLSKKT
ncbi:MAG: ADP-glyceromanno-heptose 6-epimerase [Bacteroidota bacterium]